MRKVFFLILLLSSVTKAQKNDSVKAPDIDTSLYYYYTPAKDTTIYKPQGRYFHFLASLDSATQARLVTARIAYNNTAESPAFKTAGVYVNGGFNLARLFSKKIVFGVFFDFRPVSGWWPVQYLSQNFISDFNAGFNQNFNTQSDSALANLFKDAVNVHGFSGSSFGNLGIMFSPFPQRFGGIMLSAKRGYYSSRVGRVYGNVYVHNGEADHAYMSTSANYSFEITFKPYAFFRNSFVGGAYRTKYDLLKFFSCSFFYERFNFKSAEFEGMPVSRMVSSGFMSKYAVLECYGFSVGLSFY